MHQSLKKPFHKRFINRVAGMFGADIESNVDPDVILREASDITVDFGDDIENTVNNGVALREAHGVTVDDDEDGWRKLTGDANRDITPLTQQRMQDLSVYLWRTNGFANRLIELPIAYLLADGVNLIANDDEVKQWLNRFWHDPINCLDIKLTKKLRELKLYGEQCWPTFVSPTGHVRLGYLDPGLIATVVMDPDNAEQAIGVVTCKNSKGVARRYKVICNGSESELFTRRTQAIRETFDTGECFYFNKNALSNSARGVSDLLPEIDWLDAYDNFLFGEIDRANFLRAFMWDVELANATPEEVIERAKKITAPRPNSTRVHNDAEKWNAVTPDIKAMDSDTVARLFRNHILGGQTLPEHWFGGGGDVNRATSESMGEPTFKMFSHEQRQLGYIIMEMARYVIRQRELAQSGTEPDLFDDKYAVRVEWPEMIPKDTTKYAAALTQVVVATAQAVERSIMTEQTALSMIAVMAAALGVEFDAATELENARKENNDTDIDDIDEDFDPEDDDVGKHSE